MKKTFTLLTALLITAGMYARPYYSKMSISSTGNLTLRVMIDGNRYKVNNNGFVLNNLAEGYHAVKVYRMVRGMRPSVPGGNYQLVYSSNVYVRPMYHIDISVNRFGKAFYDEQPLSNNNWDDEEEDDWNDNNWNNNNNNGNWDNNNWNNGRAMNASTFDRFKESLRNESFENTRMNIAKGVINNNYFTTAQVKEVVQLFSFENNKLEIAKYAYKNTLDKREYFSVADLFTFSNNKEELMRYIQNYR